MSVPFRFEGDGNLGVITAEKQFFTGKCILDVSAEVSYIYHVSYDARSDPEAIIIKISPKDENRRLTEADLRDFMNKLRECPAYTLLYQFSPKDTGQSKVK